MNSIYLNEYKDKDLNNTLKESLLNESIINNFQEKYPPLNPSDIVQNIKNIQNSQKNSSERISFIAKTLEGLNNLNRINISIIKNSINESIIIPCLQNEENIDINTIHILNWIDGDLSSEYFNGKIFKNHTGSLNGIFENEQDLHCSYCCGSNSCFTPLLLIINFFLYLIAIISSELVVLSISLLLTFFFVDVINSKLSTLWTK